VNTRKILLISKLAIVLLLVYTGGSTVLVRRNSAELFLPASAGGSESEGPAQADASGRELSDDFSVIVERGIFGTGGLPSADGKAGGLPSVGGELGIELVGTVCGSPAISRAIIKDTGTKALGLYRPGQTVAGATIQSIEPNAVILLHNGRVKAAETARLADSPGPAQGKVKAVNPAPYLPANRVGGESSARPASRIGCVEEILSKAAVEPYGVNGIVEGLRITGLEKVPAAESLGLENGDIIRRVNGQQLTSLQKAFQVFQKAKSQPSISMELSRGGVTKELTFNLQ
jgi:general secretion pathway protein C